MKVSLASWKRPLRLEIRDFSAHAVDFQDTLRRRKTEIALPEPGWYPWDSFGAVTPLDQLLTGRRCFVEPIHWE